MTQLLHDPAEAAALLRGGHLVAFATETVYGLGADARNGAAVAAVFEAKGRPHFNPLICHFPDAEAAFREARADDRARRLAGRFWPGPLTLVLPRRADCTVHLLAGAGLDTVAVRVPAHEQARALLREAGTPVAAPSANRSGRVSPTTSAHVLEELGGRVAAVLEGGSCEVGVESAVLDLSGGGTPTLLRPGGVPLEALRDAIGPVALPARPREGAPGPTLRSPGMLLSHYAPNLPLRLDAAEVAPGEALLAFGEPLPGAGMVFQLSLRRDPAEAARRLFAGLRALDAEGARRGLSGIAAMPVPGEGLGAAIRDRLARAAAPRGG